MTLTDRLAAKVLSSLTALLGKEFFGFEVISEAYFKVVLQISGKTRTIRVGVPEDSRVIFLIELGAFSEEQNDWLRLTTRGLAFDFQLREYQDRTDACLMQVLTVDTVDAHLPAILHYIGVDMTELDKLLSHLPPELPEKPPEKEEPTRFRIFPEQPDDPGYMRPPGTWLH